MEFRAMVADMIKEAAPTIRQEAIEEFKREQKACTDASPKKKQKVEFVIDTKDIKKQLLDALRKAFD